MYNDYNYLLTRTKSIINISVKPSWRTSISKYSTRSIIPFVDYNFIPIKFPRITEIPLDSDIPAKYPQKLIFVEIWLVILFPKSLQRRN